MKRSTNEIIHFRGFSTEVKRTRNKQSKFHYFVFIINNFQIVIFNNMNVENAPDIY